MTRNTAADVRHAVNLALAYWPNAHLGEVAPRDDIRSAFRMIRSRLDRGHTIQAAIGDLEASAYRHANM